MARADNLRSIISLYLCIISQFIQATSEIINRGESLLMLSLTDPYMVINSSPSIVAASVANLTCGNAECAWVNPVLNSSCTLYLNIIQVH